MNENIIVDTEQSVETDNVSSESDTSVGTGVDSVVPATEDEIMTLSLSETAQGTISETYLDYFEGIVQKMPYGANYVIWKSGDYSYTLAYGEDVAEENGVFTGACDTVEIVRDSTSSYSTYWYVNRGSDELSLTVTDEFVYSNLGMYPTVERGASVYESEAILFGLAVAFVFGLVTRMFDAIGRRRRG